MKQLALAKVFAVRLNTYMQFEPTTRSASPIDFAVNLISAVSEIHRNHQLQHCIHYNHIVVGRNHCFQM